MCYDTFYKNLLQLTSFAFLVAADLNDCKFLLHSVSLNMKLNIPKWQCSFTPLTTVCIVEGMTSRSAAQYQ